MEQKELSFIAFGNAKWYSSLKDTSEASYGVKCHLTM